MRVYIETLPQSYLLTLCPDEKGCYPLGEALRRALRSSQPSIWVDCRQVATLPTDTLALLRRCAKLLWRKGGHLILCHLSDTNRAALAVDASQPLAASMLDATHYGLDCPQALAPSPATHAERV